MFGYIEPLKPELKIKIMPVSGVITVGMQSPWKEVYSFGFGLPMMQLFWPAQFFNWRI